LPVAFAIKELTRPTKAAKAAIEDVKHTPTGRLQYMMVTYAPECGYDSELSRDEWPFLLREFWIGCEGFHKCIWDLRGSLPQHGPVRTLMTSRERAAYDALPETVVIYRGQDARWEPGICWSLDRETANRFAVRFRDRNPVVLTAKVTKRDILAVKLNRGEQEVITFSAAIATVIVTKERADPASAKEYIRLRRVLLEKADAARRRRAKKLLEQNAEKSACVGNGMAFTSSK
jgi:hypothetical protein